MKNMYVVLVLAMLLTTSCINTKRIVYLEDMREDISYPMNAQPEMRIQHPPYLWWRDFQCEGASYLQAL